MGAGSRSRRTLYHASINTPVAESLSEEQRRQSRERLAAELGFSSQPFAVVEHVKHGRQHTHIVWSRIDNQTGRAIPDSHNYRKHELVSRDLERDFAHERVLGAHVRDKEKQERPKRGPTWAEHRQAERSGMTPQEARRLVTECWTRTVTGAGFQVRLEAEGFVLARGDRRDFVLVDTAGEIHSVARRIEGVKAAEIRQRMTDLDPELLPSIEQARERQSIRLRQDAETHARFEKLRAEENASRRRREGERAGSPLTGPNEDIADAIRRLNTTMRSEVERTIVSKPPVQRVEVPPSAPRYAPPVPEVPHPSRAVTPPEPLKEPEASSNPTEDLRSFMPRPKRGRDFGRSR